MLIQPDIVCTSYRDGFIGLTMKDLVDYHVWNWEKAILMVGWARNRLLARVLKLFNSTQCHHFRQKAMGEGLKIGNRCACRIIRVDYEPRHESNVSSIPGTPVGCSRTGRDKSRVNAAVSQGKQEDKTGKLI